jgi:hypothetical protein
MGRLNLIFSEPRSIVDSRAYYVGRNQAKPHPAEIRGDAAGYAALNPCYGRACFSGTACHAEIR